MIRHLPAIVGVAAWAPLLMAEMRAWPRTRAAAKLLASSSFVAYAVTSGAFEAGAPGKWVFAGLVASWVGDLLLLSRTQATFLAGIGAFLLAHLAYSVAFVGLGFSAVGVAWGLVPVVALAISVGRYVLPKAGRLAPAVATYIVAIAGMMLSAASALAAQPSLVRGILVAAALAFALSDVTVARDRFIAPGFVNHAIGYPLYFGAQLAIAGLIARAL